MLGSAAASGTTTRPRPHSEAPRDGASKCEWLSAEAGFGLAETAAFPKKRPSASSGRGRPLSGDGGKAGDEDGEALCPVRSVCRSAYRSATPKAASPSACPPSSSQSPSSSLQTQEAAVKERTTPDSSTPVAFVSASEVLSAETLSLNLREVSRAQHISAVVNAASAGNAPQPPVAQQQSSAFSLKNEAPRLASLFSSLFTAHPQWELEFEPYFKAMDKALEDFEASAKSPLARTGFERETREGETREGETKWRERVAVFEPRQSLQSVADLRARHEALLAELLQRLPSMYFCSDFDVSSLLAALEAAQLQPTIDQLGEWLDLAERALLGSFPSFGFFRDSLETAALLQRKVSRIAEVAQCLRERQRLSVLQRLLESLQSLSALTASAPALLQLGELRTAALLLQNALELASPQMLRIKAARALRAKAEGTRAILSAPSLDSLRPEATRVASREAALESGLFSAEEQRLLLAEVRRNFAQRTLRFFGEGNSQSTSSPKSSGRSLEDCLPFVLFSKTQGLVATADSSAALHGGSLDSASPRLCVPLFPGLFEETCLYSQRLKGWLLRMSGTDVGVERPLNEQSLAEAAATLSQRVYGKFSVGWARAWIPEEEVLNSSKHSTKAFVWEESVCTELLARENLAASIEMTLALRSLTDALSLLKRLVPQFCREALREVLVLLLETRGVSPTTASSSPQAATPARRDSPSSARSQDAATQAPFEGRAPSLPPEAKAAPVSSRTGRGQSLACDTASGEGGGQGISSASLDSQATPCATQVSPSPTQRPSSSDKKAGRVRSAWLSAALASLTHEDFCAVLKDAFGFVLLVCKRRFYAAAIFPKKKSAERSPPFGGARSSVSREVRRHSLLRGDAASACFAGSRVESWVSFLLLRAAQVETFRQQKEESREKRVVGAGGFSGKENAEIEREADSMTRELRLTAWLVLRVAESCLRSLSEKAASLLEVRRTNGVNPSQAQLAQLCVVAVAFIGGLEVSQKRLRSRVAQILLQALNASLHFLCGLERNKGQTEEGARPSSEGPPKTGGETAASEALQNQPKVENLTSAEFLKSLPSAPLFFPSYTGNNCLLRAGVACCDGRSAAERLRSLCLDWGSAAAVSVFQNLSAIASLLLSEIHEHQLLQLSVALEAERFAGAPPPSEAVLRALQRVFFFKFKFNAGDSTEPEAAAVAATPRGVSVQGEEFSVPSSTLVALALFSPYLDLALWLPEKRAAAFGNLCALVRRLSEVYVHLTVEGGAVKKKQLSQITAATLGRTARALDFLSCFIRKIATNLQSQQPSQGTFAGEAVEGSLPRGTPSEGRDGGSTAKEAAASADGVLESPPENDSEAGCSSSAGRSSTGEVSVVGFFEKALVKQLAEGGGSCECVASPAALRSAFCFSMKNDGPEKASWANVLCLAPVALSASASVCRQLRFCSSESEGGGAEAAVFQALRLSLEELANAKTKVFARLSAILVERFKAHAATWLSIPHAPPSASSESGDQGSALPPPHPALRGLVDDVASMQKALCRSLTPPEDRSRFFSQAFHFIVDDFAQQLRKTSAAPSLAEEGGQGKGPEGLAIESCVGGGVILREGVGPATEEENRCRLRRACSSSVGRGDRLQIDCLYLYESLKHLEGEGVHRALLLWVRDVAALCASAFPPSDSVAELCAKALDPTS